MTDLRPISKLGFYLARMKARGHAPERVLRGTGLRADRLEDPRRRLHPLQYKQVILNMLELTGDPYLGIKLGEESKISDLGILGYAVLSASTLRQARELYDRYRNLNEYLFVSHNHVVDGRWFSEIQDVHQLGDVMRFAIEEFVSQTIELASTLTNRSFPVLELHVTYPQPPDLSHYLRRFNCRHFFNQPRTIVLFDINRLRDPISLANEEVFKLCARQCELLAFRAGNDAALSGLIRSHLLNNPGDFPTLEDMARNLRMGGRTLRRRLAAEGMSYQQILDETRQELAIQYLKHTALTPKEIGFLLGYSSVSNFRRAFKGWTGRTLSQARNAVSRDGGHDGISAVGGGSR